MDKRQRQREVVQGMDHVESLIELVLVTMVIKSTQWRISSEKVATRKNNAIGVNSKND